MDVPVIGFIPPIVGTDGEFNTIRLGGAYAKRLTKGQEVFLMNQKTMSVFGKAIVMEVLTGTLHQICLLHGHRNHTELGCVETPEECGARLFKLMQKIYGPHIAQENKKATVIYLRRIHEQQSRP